MKPLAIIKRDGRIDAFVPARIGEAVHKALCAVGEEDRALADELAQVVAEHLERTTDRTQIALEEVQDAVVHVLQESGQYRAAIAFSRYRDERERQRRSARLSGASEAAPNLLVLDDEGRYRRWQPTWLASVLTTHYALDARASAKVLPLVDELLAGTAVDELSMPVLLSLIDTALVRSGMHAVAGQRSAIRVDRCLIEGLLAKTANASGAQRDGAAVLADAGRALFHQWGLHGQYPLAVRRLHASGRLWFDGLDDPRRGSQFTAVLDGPANPWQILTTALTVANEARRHWRRVRLVLPPNVLGHLERGAQQFLAPILALSEQAQVYLACDGRTPLLAEWPFTAPTPGCGRHPVSIAVAHDDFLVMRQVQELGLPLLAGPHLFEPGWRATVAIELALNAQGLDGEFSTLDGLAMSLVAAAQVRLAHLGVLAEGAEIRFSLFGLPAHAPSSDYLQRQVTQEGLRAGLILRRSTHLSEDACAHLGRLLE
jgi:hypothetical protein